LKDDNKTRIVENEEEQAIINTIRDMIRVDPKITTASIIKHLDAEGIKIRNSKKIYHTAITKIIELNNLRLINQTDKNSIT
jgi:hypothetical protein